MSEKKLSARMREGADAHASAKNTGPLRAAISEWADEVDALEKRIHALELNKDLLAVCAAETFAAKTLEVNAKLEKEVERLRTLEALVAEGSIVEFRNDLPGCYPLAVYQPGHPRSHPMTWGATLATMGERGGRVTPEMIAHALEKLREAVAEEDTDECETGDPTIER